ncbi:MAG TPA: TIM-barrel domain-containing protein [Solirubrobacterales bacterium]|nr:TIM-barrel domain-containing protein [Solirubrobacterales bacterium]
MPRASAHVRFDPLRISFANASGETVLRQLGGRAGASRAVPPTPRSQFGTLDPPPPTLYAPLTFLVGWVAIEQFPTFQWNGNLDTVTEGGTEYGAVAVERARRTRAGLRLVVSTSDPSGRRLIVDLEAGPGPGTIALAARPDDPGGVAAMGDSFASPSDQAFRGFGGRHNSLDQAGSEFYNWTQQENLSSPGLGGPTPPGVPNPDRHLFPNGEHAAYYVQSSFISPGGYGFLLDRDELSDWRLASDRPDAWQVQAAAPRIDYVVAPGSSRSTIRRLTAISGRHMVPPRWAVGPALDRLVQFPEQPADEYADDVRADLRAMRANDVALDAYRIEGWQFLPRPFLKRVIAKLRGRGIRPLLYFRSFVGEDEIGTDDPSAFQEAIDRGFVATHDNGEPYVFESNFSAPGAQIDFTDPAALRWWKGRVRDALRLGAEGFMQDFGEQVQVGMHFDDGSTGATMHNRLPILFHRATRQAVRSFERRHPGRRIYYFTRNGYSGTPGAARFEFANFPGDETTDWSRSAGIASLTTDMLNRGIGGAYGFTTDIGGFYDVPYGATSRELFIRWTEWAALSPMFRIHGSVAAGTHTPWSYGEPTLRTYKRLARLHERAEPLIMRLWRHAHATGIPIARPLWLQFPGDRRAAAEEQQWMLGPDVLVAPVVTEGSRSRRVYFPRGCWQSAHGRRYRGPRTATVKAPLGRLPWFARCGTDPLG